MTPDLIQAMKTYRDASVQITEAEERRDAAKAAILALMKERGLEKVEGGGFKATISHRDYFGFNEFDETGERVPDDKAAARLDSLHAAFADFAPNLDVPASTNIAKLVDIMAAQGVLDTGRLPEYIKATKTTILRVGGG